MIKLDTTVLIDNLRGNPAARRAVVRASERGERMACSVVTKVEILGGIRAHEEADVREFFATFEWIDVDDKIAELAGATANRFMRSYPGVGAIDYIIASTVEWFNLR
jgi:predicted nucleic acid-binding protein